jgi:hypothetical protein
MSDQLIVTLLIVFALLILIGCEVALLYLFRRLKLPAPLAENLKQIAKDYFHISIKENHATSSNK